MWAWRGDGAEKICKEGESSVLSTWGQPSPEDWGHLCWLDGSGNSGSPFSRAGSLNQFPALGRKERGFLHSVNLEVSWAQLFRVFARSYWESIRDIRSHCPDHSHHHEIWEVKLFQGQLSHLLLEVGFQWLHCLEPQAWGLKHTETCLGDVGEGGPWVARWPLRGFPRGGRAVNSQGASLTPQQRVGAGGQGAGHGFWPDWESAWVVVAVPPGRSVWPSEITSLSRAQFPHPSNVRALDL